PDPAQRDGGPGLGAGDPGVHGLSHLDGPRRRRVDGRGDLPDHLRVGLGEQGHEAGFLVGEVRVEGTPGRARPAHDVGDRGGPVPVRGDRVGEGVQQPLAEQALVLRRPGRVLVQHGRHATPCAGWYAVVPWGRYARVPRWEASPMTTVTLPPGPTTPRFVQAAYALAVPRRGMDRMRERYGDAFMVNVPFFGRALVISDPAEIRQLFLAGPDVADNLDRNLGRVLGPGSLFALRGDEHHRRRRLLIPPFHGRRLAAYERTVEAETVRELASWPENRPFPVLPSTMRITLNVILRAVFGSDGAEFDALRELLPRVVTLGSRLAVRPRQRVHIGRFGPWGRFRAMRREYDAIVDRLVDKAVDLGSADPHLDERDDILALMLQARYDDGSAMGRREIADQLLTLLAAGHETTATTLAWAVERLRRHPDLLAALVNEADAEAHAGGSA